MIIYINDHDKEIKGNVWDYTLLEKDNSGKPTFTKNKPVQIFSNVYLIPQLLFIFAIPSWFTKFKTPIPSFNDTPPT